jgi:hypothetical protein
LIDILINNNTFKLSSIFFNELLSDYKMIDFLTKF